MTLVANKLLGKVLRSFTLTSRRVRPRSDTRTTALKGRLMPSADTGVRAGSGSGISTGPAVFPRLGRGGGGAGGWGAPIPRCHSSPEPVAAAVSP